MSAAVCEPIPHLTEDQRNARIQALLAGHEALSLFIREHDRQIDDKRQEKAQIETELLELLPLNVPYSLPHGYKVKKSKVTAIKYPEEAVKLLPEGSFKHFLSISEDKLKAVRNLPAEQGGLTQELFGLISATGKIQTRMQLYWQKPKSDKPDPVAG